MSILRQDKKRCTDSLLARNNPTVIIFKTAFLLPVATSRSRTPEKNEEDSNDIVDRKKIFTNNFVKLLIAMSALVSPSTAPDIDGFRLLIAAPRQQEVHAKRGK